LRPADEERNAAGHLVAGGREGRLHLGAERQPHELGHRPLAQRRELEDLGRRVGGERREQRRALSRPGRPRRGDDRDRQLLDPTPEVVQETQRGLVSPVHVVDAEQQRRSPPEVRRQPVQPVQDRERGVEQRVGRIIPRRRKAEQPRRVPGRPCQELGPFRRRGRDHRGLEQLADQAIREVSFEFRTARAQRRQAKLAAMPSGRQH
jgi:hypothetical protein